ncbi:TlyA family RNA methyltransferase [Cumulibacter manganitolerans]|uniref:TlyA family RNA methyltransferase n=1 Tax=Cumulibacter manganitolerans TaxID=1884992 RepID=UPI0012981A4C|nr:TlyA family RNA methyltransferase [Cumulibacter manganitolerans]
MASNAPAEADPTGRLDAALVDRGLSRSRQTAGEAIRGRRVRINGVLATKPATRVRRGDQIEVAAGDGDHLVSRAAHKLAGALDALGIDVRGRRCVDVGASTGGFTQILLERGAAHVTAIDVGTDQLVAVLRDDPRVTSMEGVHVGRDDLGAVAPAPVVVADLSFISLRHVMGPLVSLVAPGGTLLPMVKPQFEVGRTNLGRGGVVDDPGLHREAVAQVVAAAAGFGFGPVAIVTSPLPGPAGNLEFFVQLREGEPDAGFDALWAARAPQP